MKRRNKSTVLSERELSKIVEDWSEDENSSSESNCNFFEIFSLCTNDILLKIIQRPMTYIYVKGSRTPTLVYIHIRVLVPV